MIWRNKPKAAVVTLVLALSLSTMGTFTILRVLPQVPSDTSPLAILVVSFSLGTLITSAFYSGLYRGIFLKQSNPFKDYHTLVSYTAIIQAVATALYMRSVLPAAAFYFSSVTLQSWTSWLLIQIARPGLNVKHPVMIRLPWVAAISTGSMGLLAWPIQNFWPIDTLLAAIVVWQSLTLLTILLGVWMWFAWHPKFSFKGQTPIASLANRLQNEDDDLSMWVITSAAVFLQTFTILSFILGLKPEASAIWPNLLNTIHLYACASLVFIWAKISKYGIDKEHYTTLAKLAAVSAKRMLRRKTTPDDVWAATVGLKTTAFTIDHDPESQVTHSIPATLLRIRNDEITNMVNQITQRQTLYLNNVGQKIIGTFDPEQSARPCVDALNLFAALYLDAGPIIERRISGLVSLLPIVNPGLAKIVSTNQIIPLLRKNHWFFHFDFTWVDQSLINTPSATRYGIQMDLIPLDTQWSLLNEMKKTHSLGNFLWLGREAHDRILQEAPHIASITTPHVLKDEFNGEHLIFAIKFEQLVPRLQRYYDLDAVRSRIIDYDPRPEAQRLLNLLSMQAQSTENLHDKRRVVESIISYNWYGFKEKDHALRLLQKIYISETERLASATVRDRAKDESFLDLIKNAISQIGYPSQILNQAHVYKIELRNIPKLKTHALNHSSQRFEEAWVLMSNMNYQNMHAEDAKLVREIIMDALKSPNVMQTPFVHAKMLDTVIALGRRDDANPSDLDLLLNILDIVIKLGTTDDCLALGIDGAIFISQKLNTDIRFKPATTRYFEGRQSQLGQSNSRANTAISSRWQEIKSRTSQPSDAGPKAS